MVEPTSVASVMILSPLTVGAQASIGEVERRALARGSTHALVVEGDVVRGIVCLPIDQGVKRETPVSDVMCQAVHGVSASMALPDAERIMDEHRVCCLPVFASGVLVGVLFRRHPGVAISDPRP